MNRVLFALGFAMLANLSPNATVAAEKPTHGEMYVGDVKGGHASARFAIVVGDGEFVAYLCSQDDDFNKTHATWFRGKVENGTIEASNDDKRTLKGKIQDKSATFTIGGAKSDLTATALHVPHDGVSGLYRDEADIAGEFTVAGWIIDEKGNVAGAIRGPKTVSTPKLPSNVRTPKDVAKISAPAGTGANAVPLKANKLQQAQFALFRITSVKNLGNNVGDDSTDRIEVKWDISRNAAQDVKEYIVEVRVTYGDGTTDSKGKNVDASARSAEVRVAFKSNTPTKSFNVKLTAVPKNLETGTLRTAVKSGNF